MALFPSWLRRPFSSQGFRRSVLTLLSGSAASSILSFAALSILTRLYSPEAFGTLDYFVALLSTLVPVASFRYEDAVMLPEDDREAAHVFRLALLLTLGWCLALAALLPWGGAIAGALRMPEVGPWLWLLPPALLLMRFVRLGELWLGRRKAFTPISAAQVSSTTAMTATRLVAGIPPFRATAGGLIGGGVAGQAVACLVLAGALWRKGARTLLHGFSLRQLKRLAHRYRRFPQLAAPSTLLAVLVARLPTFLLPRFFDVAVVGFFGRAFGVVAVPLGLIGGAISHVFLVHAAEAHRAGSLATLTGTVHARLVMIGLFPVLTLVLGGPDLFAFVFSEAWREAGVYVRYLAPWLFLSAVASPLTHLFDVLERQRAALLTSLAMFTLLFGALWIGGRTGSVPIALMLLGLAGALARVFHIATMLWLARVPWRTALRPYGRYALISLPFLLPVGIALFAERPWLTTLAAALGGCGYGAFVVWREQLLQPPPEAGS